PPSYLSLIAHTSLFGNYPRNSGTAGARLINRLTNSPAYATHIGKLLHRRRDIYSPYIEILKLFGAFETPVAVMSLNGLDDPTILSEYQSAVDEPNRWFLLQYVARDAIALLSSGGGGPPELRSAVEEYSEVKPLFGFIHFHSRKIVLKIVPDGTSRLFL
ncbi:hypothetical protein KEM55_003531, partial [Ascosphaera atra]